MERDQPFAVRDTCADKVHCELIGVSGRDTAVLRLIGWEEGVAGSLHLSGLQVYTHRNKVTSARETFEAQIFSREPKYDLLELIKKTLVVRTVCAVSVYPPCSYD
jgi:hypothetical protein